MKHLRVTPLRWLRRVPGRIYRDQTFRMLAVFLVTWEAIYWGTWQFMSREQKDASVLLSLAGLLATFLLLALMNWWWARRARKFMQEGVSLFEAGTRRYALGVLAKIENLHGKFLTLPGPDGAFAVKCACGAHIGNTRLGVPSQDQPLVKEWETHVESQVKLVMDEFEGKLNARNARRSASI